MAVITLSRQYGSMGNQIAGLVRDQLGYQFFDKNLMADLGSETGLLSKKQLEEADEIVQPSALQRFFSATAYQGDPSKWTYGARADTVAQLSPTLIRRLILAAYDLDNIIIVGRGGQIVLRGKPDVLHVRTLAPKESVAERVAKWEGLPLEDALRSAQQKDRAMRDFIKTTYAVDVADPELYDLIINTGKLTADAAAELIVEAVRCLPPRA